ncbi:GTPase [Joostella sp.]|uniref:GTPase n=1 Tax=Joostella sp. TaxID=2231138 RepID=UPI003A918E32
MSKPTLLFVYNAKAGMVNGLFDAAHKIVSPNTYACSLCKLTHGNFKEKEVWRSFRTNNNVAMEFLYKEHLNERYPEFLAAHKLPLVLIEEENCSPEIFLTSDQIAANSTVESLIETIKENLPTT